MADNQQTADDDLSSLKATVSQTNQRAAAAESRASAAENELVRARQVAAQAVGERTKADKLAATQAIAAAEQEIARLESELGEAMKSGDAPGVAKATRGIASSQGRLDGWTGQKARIDNWERNELKKVEAALQQRQEQANGGMSTRTKAWLDAHADVRDTPAKLAKAQSAHWDAISSGLAVDTDQYFAHVEKFMGLNQPTAAATAHTATDATGAVVVDPLSDAGHEEEAEVEEKPVVAAAPARRENAASAAAAPSRGNGNGGQRASASSVRLSASEVEIAKSTYSWLKTDDEKIKAYAKDKSALAKEGRLTA